MIESGYQKPFSLVETIQLTPEMAQGLLDLSKENNFKNRNTHSTRIELLANEIRNGNWMDSNDAICIDEEGVLINGYHRCKAVVMADIPIWVTIKRGMLRDTFHSMDTGKKRSVSDVLQTRYVKHATTVARACRIIFIYEKVGIQCFATTADPLVSNNDVLRKFDENPLIVNSCEYVYKKSRLVRLMPPGFLAFTHYTLSKKHLQPTVENFFEGVNSGDNLENNNPIKLLRIKLLDDIIGIGGRQLTTPAKIGLFTKAWNYSLEGKTLQMLRFAENAGEQIQDFN